MWDHVIEDIDPNCLSGAFRILSASVVNLPSPKPIFSGLVELFLLFLFRKLSKAKLFSEIISEESLKNQETLK